MALITFDTFIKNHLNKAMDYDGVAFCQCIDLCKYYLKEVFGLESGAWGDAHCWYENYNNIPTLKNNFDRIANTPSFIPKKGDIMVWSGKLSSGGHGHVAICDGVGDTTYFYSYDNNWTGNHDATARIKHNYNCVLGVLRPKNQEQITGKVEDKVTTNTKNVKLKGIDISVYQNNPDFTKVKGAVDYVIIRAGYGKYSSQKDERFERNYSECKKNNIPCGAYWFSYSVTAADAKKEAKACLEAIKGKQFEYPIYYDIEGGSLTDKATVSAMCKEFCGELEKNGYYAGIYMSRIPAQNLLDDECIKKYTLWLAEYDSNKLNWNKACDMWQYSSTGRVNGIGGSVDTDYCYVDFPAIIKNGGFNGFKKATTPTTTTEKKELTELDVKGFKKGDKGFEALAVKTLLKLAISKKLVSGSVDDTSGLGGGSIKIVNALLKKWGYKENGIAGTNFINRLYKELK